MRKRETSQERVGTVFIYDALQPIFDKLSDVQLLERCKDGFTQNQNESFKTFEPIIQTGVAVDCLQS